ncbi:MAG: N-(5'-phosphoribosyl)anthranilate isomerase [Candidatus Binatia bacterium]
MVKVKVCGITNLKDALKAVELGADALGFNFYSASQRFVSPEHARLILTELPPHVCNIALFVNEPRARVQEILSTSRLAADRQAFSGLQFHGEESPEYCRGWREFKVIKAFRVKDRESLGAMRGFPADFYLLDSWAPGYGGSGLSFPWSWLQGLKVDKLILAGGLDTQNVREAIQRLHPYGVDVCTGVEARPGIKDHGKLKEFLLAAKGAE